MSALISRTDDIICMLDVNMMVEKLRAMLKFFETDTQTDTQTFNLRINVFSGFEWPQQPRKWPPRSKL